MLSVASHLPEVSGHNMRIGKTGRKGCCDCIPRVAGLVVKGVHDAAGTLLSFLSILSSLYSFVFDFLKIGEALCRKLVVAIAV